MLTLRTLCFGQATDNFVRYILRLSTINTAERPFPLVAPCTSDASHKPHHKQIKSHQEQLIDF